MECILGIRFNDFVLLATDTIDARSIVVMKHGELSSTLLLEDKNSLKIKTLISLIYHFR